MEFLRGVIGSALGSSLWMPVTAITSGWSGAGVALSDMTAIAVLLAALGIWSNRHRLTAFQGFMLLLGAVFAASATFLLGARTLAGLVGAVIVAGWQDDIVAVAALDFVAVSGPGRLVLAHAQDCED